MGYLNGVSSLFNALVSNDKTVGLSTKEVNQHHTQTHTETHTNKQY